MPAIAALRAFSGEDKLRGFKAFRYGAGSWNKERRLVARDIEATSKGLDVRYVVTSLKAGASIFTRPSIARAGKRRELHQAAQEPARFRPDLLPRSQSQPVPLDPAHRRLLALACNARRRSQRLPPLSTAEFATTRLRLIKIAARVVEGAARIRVYLPTACPDRAIFRALAGRLCAAGP